MIDTFSFSSAAALPALHAAADKTTVSGLSSGGFMAVQLHVAYSDVFKGAGVFAGGPFYCAQGKELSALVDCMRSPSKIDDSILESDTQNFQAQKKIAETANLAEQPVYMFSGKEDTTVFRGVMDALVTYYQFFKADVAYETSVDANHAVPTDLDRVTNACNYLGSPYINNCGYDGVGAMFKQILVDKPAERDLSWEKNGKIIEFDQTEFVANESMDDTGFVFVPNGCSRRTKSCAVHVALHGCKQGAMYIQDTFVKDAGYLEWAGVNDVIVLFPQAVKSGFQNPEGCWDWWGYTTQDYAERDGPQMKAIVDMVERLQSKASPASSVPTFEGLNGLDVSGLKDLMNLEALMAWMTSILSNFIQM